METASIGRRERPCRIPTLQERDDVDGSRIAASASAKPDAHSRLESSFESSLRPGGENVRSRHVEMRRQALDRAHQLLRARAARRGGASVLPKE